MLNLTCEITSDLVLADKMLEVYGRWAADRPQIRTCGSAEGKYKSPQDDIDRQPVSQVNIDEMMACQKALAAVNEKERIVLTILYIPRKVPIQAQIRLYKLDQRVFPERHRSGLKQFDLLLHLFRNRDIKAIPHQG